MLTPTELQAALAQCTGTEHYYKMPFYAKVIYTDGVKCFCENAEAYWFLDTVAPKIHEMKEFHSILLQVKDGKADIIIKNADNQITRDGRTSIFYTDCPDGEYLFFVGQDYCDGKEVNVMMWHDEY